MWELLLSTVSVLGNELRLSVLAGVAFLPQTPHLAALLARHFSQNTHLSHPGLFDLWDQFARCLVACSEPFCSQAFGCWLTCLPCAKGWCSQAPAGYLGAGSHLLSDLQLLDFPTPHSSWWVPKGMSQASSSYPHLSTALEGLSHTVSQRELYFAFPCVWCKDNTFASLTLPCGSSLSSHWPVFPIQMVLDLQWLDSGLCDLAVVSAVMPTVETASPPPPRLKPP